MHTHERDVVAPRDALAWAEGTADMPGRWLYHEDDIVASRTRGEVIRRTEPGHDQTWLRAVSGDAQLADVISLATTVDDLRLSLLDLLETAAQALSSGDKTD